MTVFENMSATVKIRAPIFLDDPIVGRCISPLPLGIVNDHIIIEHGELTYFGSKISSKKSESYHLKNIEKLILFKKNVTCWTDDHKLDPYGRIGTEILTGTGQDNPLL